MNSTKSAGKGSKPRNCFSQNFRNNFDDINWGNNKKHKIIEKHEAKHSTKSTTAKS